MIHSICTIADHRAYDELVIMLKSLSLFNELTLYVGGDQTVCERLAQERFTNRLSAHVLLTDGQTPRQGSPEWLALMTKKMDILDIALAKERNTLFLDADMIFLNPLWGIDLERHDVALSQHMILPEDEARWGKYNGGYVGVGQRDFPTWWREATLASKYYEQECLVRAHERFRVQEISIHHNFGWWRLNQCDAKRKWWRFDLPNRPNRKARLANFCVERDQVLYAAQPLVSIHTHIRDWSKKGYRSANRLVHQLLSQSTDPRHREVLELITAKAA